MVVHPFLLLYVMLIIDFLYSFACLALAVCLYVCHKVGSVCVCVCVCVEEEEEEEGDSEARGLWGAAA